MSREKKSEGINIREVSPGLMEKNFRRGGRIKRRLWNRAS